MSSMICSYNRNCGDLHFCPPWIYMVSLVHFAVMAVHYLYCPTLCDVGNTNLCLIIWLFIIPCRLYTRRHGVERLASFMCVCLSLCFCSERKMDGAIDTILGRPIVHVKTLACTDPEVRVKSNLLSFASALWHCQHGSCTLIRLPVILVTCCFCAYLF